MEKRRNHIRRFAGALTACAFGSGALACELPPGVRVESERVTLSYWTIPAHIAVGAPFVLELAACPKRGVPLAERVKLTRTCPSIATA